MLSVTHQTLCGGDTFGGEVELVCLCTHVANMFTPANTEQGFRPQDLGFCTIDDVVIADKSNGIGLLYYKKSLKSWRCIRVFSFLTGIKLKETFNI